MQAIGLWYTPNLYRDGERVRDELRKAKEQGFRIVIAFSWTGTRSRRVGRIAGSCQPPTLTVSPAARHIWARCSICSALWVSI